jgi:hypothetical protein
MMFRRWSVGVDVGGPVRGDVRWVRWLGRFLDQIIGHAAVSSDSQVPRLRNLALPCRGEVDTQKHNSLSKNIFLFLYIIELMYPMSPPLHK